MKRKFSFRIKLDVFLLIFLLIISSVLLTFSGGRFIIDFKSVGFSVAAGTENAVHSVSAFVTDTVSAVRELAELRSKYLELSEKLKDYELLQRSNADIRRENRELKELLGFADTIAYKNIPAQISGFDPDNLYSGIIINRGAKHGVRKNMPVLAFQGSNVGLVGKIVQTGRDSSMIIPIYDYQCYVAASVQTTKHRGLVNGQGTADLPLIMRYVQKRAKDEISIGDRILASGENDLFPKDSPIGVVTGIRVHDYETYLELTVQPIIDFSRLDYVFVLDMSGTNEGAAE
ncbi:rod shape-determining protein MreC [Treponema vincentii]|jgi:rod shape-determining protein mreC|uniref:Cell shape-determining protein MreC n=2 Tax=Treponema vincentii TaxID=69710 RepID=S3MF52_9SPIR|nr:rod shape-determining protein MreC [Treponema vincentii]EEV19929.1 rod shape-determining protein MreC [Treponema vincentii ATCC 35580]EPF47649.1 rod shape-determining protein MreC [Treponema vincentii F0403]UTC48457.1 rod shape-determining protein MreC [Treponema vincentii]